MKRISIALDGMCATQHPIYRDWLLEDRAQRSGFAISPIGDETVRLHIEINYSSSKSPKNLHGIPRENRVLFALEPRAVLPMQHRERVREKFGLVLVTSPDQVQDRRDVYFDYGFLFPGKNTLSGSPREVGSIAMLNANKSSFVGGSQYSTRRSLIKRLATLGFSVTVAGAGWSKSFQEQFKDSIGSFLFCLSQGELPDVTRFRMPNRPNIQNVRFSGIVADGNLFLQEHEFALIVENDPDYVSEKLFNALDAGCIPLYLGPRLRKLGIPESLIVDLGSETDSSLMSLRSDAARKDSIGKLGRSYIIRPDVQEYWSHEAGVKRFFEALRSRLSGQIGI